MDDVREYNCTIVFGHTRMPVLGESNERAISIEKIKSNIDRENNGGSE